MLRAVAEELADARAYECVLALQIEHQNQIWKTFQQSLPELFLPLHLPLQCALFGYVDQRALVTDQPSRFHHAARSIDADRDSAVFSSQPNLARTSAAALASAASEHRIRARINGQLLRRQVQ